MSMHDDGGFRDRCVDEMVFLRCPDAGLPAPIEWPEDVAFLCHRLTLVFTEFIARDRAGRLADFIWVLSPFEKRPSLNMVHQRTVLLSALRELSDAGESIPEQIQDVSNLVPFAVTDDGDAFHWLHQQGGCVAVNEARRPVCHFSNPSPIECLIADLKGESSCLFCPSWN